MAGGEAANIVDRMACGVEGHRFCALTSADDSTCVRCHDATYREVRPDETVRASAGLYALCSEDRATWQCSHEHRGEWRTTAIAT